MAAPSGWRGPATLGRPLTAVGRVLARAFSHHVSAPSACPYLAANHQTLAVYHLLAVSPEELAALLARGFRRFGFAYFRPVCACLACDSLRVRAIDFAPSKTQRRVARKGAHLTVSWGEPTLDAERLALYQEWHRAREGARGWGESDLDAESYAESFCVPHPCAREVSYRQDGRLVAVGIVDEAHDALSAVYCYYDPALAEMSLGVLNVLTCLARTRELGLTFLYLGYRVEDCPSLRYKGTFRPYETLVGRPADGEPTWARAVTP